MCFADKLCLFMGNIRRAASVAGRIKYVFNLIKREVLGDIGILQKHLFEGDAFAFGFCSQLIYELMSSVLADS